jgi:hypothetical protein
MDGFNHLELLAFSHVIVAFITEDEYKISCAFMEFSCAMVHWKPHIRLDAQSVKAVC